MPRRPIAFILFLALLAAGTLRAEEPQPATEPEKKPDAFQYFFGPKEKEAPAPAVPPIEEQPASPAAAPEPVAEPVEAPKAEPAPQVPQAAVPEAPRAPEAPQAKPDAFQYFFGQSAATEERKPEEGPAAEPVKKGSAFEYFFGEKKEEEKKRTAEQKPPR